MKRIPLAVAVAALLSTSAVLADPVAPQPAPLRSAVTPTAAEPLATLQGSYTAHPNAATWTPVQGTFQGSYTGHANPASWTQVKTSFQDTYVGD